MRYHPQLATLVKSPPVGNEWLHEMKYDGYRIGCLKAKGRVTLISRNGKDWTHAFAEIVAAASRLTITQALVDGEVTFVLPDGRTSFQALQNAATGGSRAGVVYFVFDLLEVDGTSLLALPLEERKARLRKIVGRSSRSHVRFADHVIGDGSRVFREACRLGFEGIVSKRRDGPYRPGKRVDWLKTKCTARQEFVIGGFTDPKGSREGIGALLVGYYAGHDLVFAGKVGTGFTRQLARDLRVRLDRLVQPSTPFTRGSGLPRNAHWVRPELVGEVAFTEWTDDGKIRHPSFQGLRADKSPHEVTIERPRSPKALGRQGVRALRR